MATNYNPRIVTDGLVLCLDAGNAKNYNLTEVEVLVVAGGGGGGGRSGGGGGAGGLIYNSNFSVSPGTAISLTVGDGGTGGAGSGPPGSDGGNSIFGSLTAIGGGGGGSDGATGGRTGGSGGGGKYGSAGGTGTSGQGFAGGSGTSNTWKAGGGGGAGGVGLNGVGGTHKCGDGGPGLGFSISGTFTYYAGGGGGGSHNSGAGGCCDDVTARGLGGIGGGGNGGIPGGYNAGDNATANSGGGGGGGSTISGNGGAGGNGGSGIVIVRYPGPQKAIGGTVTSVAGHTIHTFTTVGSTTFTPLVATNNSTILGLSDLSGNGNFGTTVNSPTYSSANGGSINFDGINEYMSSTISNNPTTQITLESWIYPERAPSTGTIRGAALSGNPNHYLGIFNSIDGGVTHSLHWALQTSVTRPGSQVGNIPRFAWSYIVGTYDGTRMKAYINGSLVYDVALTGTISGNGNWTVGCYQPAPTDGTHNFDGLISNAKIYNKALTASEILQNYNATKSKYKYGSILNPFTSPVEAQTLGYTAGEYYFKSGSMSSAQLLEYQPSYYESRPFCCVFRSSYRSAATTNKIDLNIPMGGLLVQRDTLDLRAAVYWSTPIVYNTVGGSGNNTADSGYSPRRVILGGSGGHGIYATNQIQCNWGTATGAIGAGWDGSTCGSFPNDLIWGTGRSDTATYENRSGTWSHWITWV